MAAMHKKIINPHVKSGTKRKMISQMHDKQWKYQKGGLIEYGDGGLNWNGIQGAGNIKGGLGIAGMAGGVLQAAGGQDSFAAQGLGGAASGAAAGMMLGPLGAIVGGAIGGGIGLLKANAANKAQDAQERAQMEQRQGMIRMQQQSDATENPYAATFAYGGRVPGYDPMIGSIPEVAVYGKRPVKPIVPNTPSIYTPQGGGNWSYNGGQDQWVNTVNKDKQGKPMIMSPEDYESKYPKQMRQANYRSLYAQGGMIPQGMPNAELEKQEVTQGPDGSMQKMNMPSHANATGKNQVALEPGTRIYSDKLKPKGEKKTYADLADDIRKQMAKYEQMMYA